MTTDRMITINPRGKVHCIDAQKADERVAIPSDLEKMLDQLACDLQLGLDCIAVWGGVPIPVAKAILRNAKLAQTAIEYALSARRPD